MARFAVRSLAFVLVSLWAAAQPAELDKPVPILTGSIGNFSFVTGGNNLLDSEVNPILLVPFGDRWMVESRAEFEGQFQRPPGGGPYGVSTTSIGMDSVDSECHAGARLGLFLPGPRLEVGGSWRRTFEDDRKNAFGFHMGWQPAKAPLNLRSEFAHSFEGSGYWVEGAYRLSQVHFWQKALRRTEVVSRAQGFYVGEIGAAGEAAFGVPTADMREADFRINYFLRDGLKAIASYGRQFISAGNANQWSFGLAYRFLISLGRVATATEPQ